MKFRNISLNASRAEKSIQTQEAMLVLLVLPCGLMPLGHSYLTCLTAAARTKEAVY